MKDPLLKGHPLHAVLTDLPIGLLAGGTACDLLAFATRQVRWRFAARAAHTGAFATGCATALVGLWDYQAVPREHPARRVGAIHGYLNASMLALLLASLLLRQESRTPSDGRPRTSALVLTGAALAVLIASGWLGGDLVYRLGWRVVPAEHAEQLEDALAKRGDTGLIEQAHATVHEYEQTHALLP